MPQATPRDGWEAAGEEVEGAEEEEEFENDQGRSCCSGGETRRRIRKGPW
jgi:hypothetical protein